jgi:hypothetical protein
LEAFLLFPKLGQDQLCRRIAQGTARRSECAGLAARVATVGSFLKILQGLEGRAEGDPRKIADVYCATGE